MASPSIVATITVQPFDKSAQKQARNHVAVDDRHIWVKYVQLLCKWPSWFARLGRSADLDRNQWICDCSLTTNGRATATDSVVEWFTSAILKRVCRPFIWSLKLTGLKKSNDLLSDENLTVLKRKKQDSVFKHFSKGFLLNRMQSIRIIFLIFDLLIMTAGKLFYQTSNPSHSSTSGTRH